MAIRRGTVSIEEQCSGVIIFLEWQFSVDRFLRGSFPGGHFPGDSSPRTDFFHIAILLIRKLKLPIAIMLHMSSYGENVSM